MRLSRRSVLAAGAICAAGAGPVAVGSGNGVSGGQKHATFSLKYVPHEGSFEGRGNLLEQVAYASNRDFNARDHNEAASRRVDHDSPVSFRNIWVRPLHEAALSHDFQGAVK